MARTHFVNIIYNLKKFHKIVIQGVDKVILSVMPTVLYICTSKLVAKCQLLYMANDHQSVIQIVDKKFPIVLLRYIKDIFKG